MDQAQIPSEENQNLAVEAMESLGEPEAAAQEMEESSADNKDVKDDLPLIAKERLGRQEKRHKKEMRALQDQLRALQAKLSPTENTSADSVNPYYGEQMQAGSDEDKIAKAVNLVLRQKEMQERQAKEAEQRAHVQKQYERLQDDLDNAASEYDDFDDVVRAHDAPFTDAMRDTALLLHNPAQVLYKLGKNREELKRISQLHPLDQAREMFKLSVALTGGENKGASAPVKPISPIKSSPVSSHASVSDKTPVSELRKRMKADWK